MIQCDSLVKIYEMEQHKVMALEGLDLTIEDGGNDGNYRQIRQWKVHIAEYHRRTGNTHSRNPYGRWKRLICLYGKGAGPVPP